MFFCSGDNFSLKLINNKQNTIQKNITKTRSGWNESARMKPALAGDGSPANQIADHQQMENLFTS
jgi:hypothetical protein